MAAYFHLQHCIDGFGQLLKALMGVSLVRVPLSPGKAIACTAGHVTRAFLKC